MANVELRLKVSKSAYLDKIAKLESLSNECDSAIGRYESLEKDLDKFMGGEDDNYEVTREGIRNNIKMVRKQKEMCENSIQMLRDTLQDMEDFGQGAGQLLQEAVTSAKQTLKSAVEITQLLN